MCCCRLSTAPKLLDAFLWVIFGAWGQARARVILRVRIRTRVILRVGVYLGLGVWLKMSFFKINM